MGIFNALIVALRVVFESIAESPKCDFVSNVKNEEY